MWQGVQQTGGQERLPAQLAGGWRIGQALVGEASKLLELLMQWLWQQQQQQQQACLHTCDGRGERAPVPAALLSPCAHAHVTLISPPCAPQGLGLEHPNIIRCFKCWEDTSAHCINLITELFTSGNLRQ